MGKHKHMFSVKFDWKINTESRSSICLLRNRFAARPGGKTAKDKAISHYLVFCVVSQELFSLLVLFHFFFTKANFGPIIQQFMRDFVVHANGILSGESLMSVVHCVTRDHDDQLEAEG